MMSVVAGVDVQPGWEPLVVGVAIGAVVAAIGLAAVIGGLVSLLADPDDRAKVFWSTTALVVFASVGAAGVVVVRARRG